MDLYPHSAAIIESLQAGGLTVGDHVAPKASQKGEIVAPCTVVYLRPGGALVGSVDGPDPDGILPFQLTNVGRTAGEALHQADLAHQALEDHPPMVDGWCVHYARKVNGGAAAYRDPDLTPPMFYVPVEYRLVTAEDLST